MEIYWISGSSFAWRVLLTAEVKGIPYEGKLLEASKGDLLGDDVPDAAQLTFRTAAAGFVRQVFHIPPPLGAVMILVGICFGAISSLTRLIDYAPIRQKFSLNQIAERRVEPAMIVNSGEEDRRLRPRAFGNRPTHIADRDPSDECNSLGRNCPASGMHSAA